MQYTDFIGAYGEFLSTGQQTSLVMKSGFCSKFGIQKSRHHFLHVWRHNWHESFIFANFFAPSDHFSHCWQVFCIFRDQAEIKQTSNHPIKIRHMAIFLSGGKKHSGFQPGHKIDKTRVKSARNGQKMRKNTSKWLLNVFYDVILAKMTSRFHFLRVWRHKKRFAVILTYFFALSDRFSHFWHVFCQFRGQAEIH